MAGRGRRIGGYGEKGVPLRRPGEAVVQSHGADIDVQTLTQKISEIQVTNADPLLMHDTEVLFKQLCATSEALSDVLSSLHAKALSDSSFGEKLVIALEQVSTLEIDRVCVRSELLTFVENDFRMKDALWQGEPRKFANAVMLLGGVYNFIKIHGVPIGILGSALLEYMELLLQGDEEHHKVLTVQVLMNGGKLSASENLSQKYEMLKRGLRKALVHGNLSPKSKCWILLALDFMSNQLKLLNGVVRDFYVENLGDDYSSLESSFKEDAPRSARGISTPRPKPERAGSKRGDKPDKNEEDALSEVENVRMSNEVGKGRRGDDGRGTTAAASRNRKWEEGKAKGERVAGSKENSLGSSDDDFYGIQIPKERIKTKKSGDGESAPEDKA